jgi:hypothetical protein
MCIGKRLCKRFDKLLDLPSISGIFRRVRKPSWALELDREMRTLEKR